MNAKPLEIQISKAASDYRYGFENEAFAESHGGIDNLRCRLFELVEEWEISEMLGEMSKFITSHHSNLMIKAHKGRDLPGDPPSNRYNTKKSGGEYEAWLTIERVGLAKKAELNEEYYSFTLTSKGVDFVKHLIRRSSFDKDLLF